MLPWWMSTRNWLPDSTSASACCAPAFVAAATASSAACESPAFVRVASATGASHGHLREQDGGLPDADGLELPVLAARPGALVDVEIVAQALDLEHRVRRVASERDVLDRRAELAALDQVGLGDR